MTRCGSMNTFDNSTVTFFASQGCECKLVENSLTDFSLAFLTEPPTLKLKKLERGICGIPGLSHVVDSRDFSNWSTGPSKRSQIICAMLPRWSGAHCNHSMNTHFLPSEFYRGNDVSI